MLEGGENQMQLIQMQSMMAIVKWDSAEGKIVRPVSEQITIVWLQIKGSQLTQPNDRISKKTTSESIAALAISAL